MNGFQIISKLGEGAYSVVYKVRRLIDNNIYALKKVKLANLSEKEKSNALNEVRILASVKSNFVISYKEAFFDEKDSCLGIVMEYADKGDLYQKITQYKKAGTLIEETDIWRILIQLVKGLKALHELKILHRDLKSANVFLFSDGSAKLGDLNVSKVAKKGLGYTQTGTPYYASPEVWNDKPYGSKSDIWSLGCVIYEMTTLRPPFRAESMEGLYNKVIKGNYNKIPSRYSQDLSEIIRHLIQVDPDKRLSCEEILNLQIIKKRIEYFKAFSGEDLSEDAALLQTINIPKNLLFLSEKLPQPNYEKKKNYNSYSHQMKLKELDTTQKSYIDSKERYSTLQSGSENKLPKINSVNVSNAKISETNELKKTNEIKEKPIKIIQEKKPEEPSKDQEERKPTEPSIVKELDNSNVRKREERIQKTEEPERKVISIREEKKNVVLPPIKASYMPSYNKINLRLGNDINRDRDRSPQKYKIKLNRGNKRLEELYKIYAPVLHNNPRPYNNKKQRYPKYNIMYSQNNADMYKGNPLKKLNIKIGNQRYIYS